jgi:hypothetical protein
MMGGLPSRGQAADAQFSHNPAGGANPVAGDKASARRVDRCEPKVAGAQRVRRFIHHTRLGHSAVVGRGHPSDEAPRSGVAGGFAASYSRVPGVSAAGHDRSQPQQPTRPVLGRSAGLVHRHLQIVAVRVAGADRVDLLVDPARVGGAMVADHQVHIGAGRIKQP